MRPSAKGSVTRAAFPMEFGSDKIETKRGVKKEEVKKGRSLSTPVGADEGKADDPQAHRVGLTALTRAVLQESKCVPL